MSALGILGCGAGLGAAWLMLADVDEGPRRLARIRGGPGLQHAVEPDPPSGGAGLGMGTAGQAVGRLGPDRPARRVEARTRLAAGVLAGLAVAALVGGWLGALGGTALGALLTRWLGRLEPREARARRDRLAAQAPEVADLLAACLASGATFEASLSAVSGAVEDPARDLLRSVVARMRLGADPAAAWATGDDALAGVARAVQRCTESGAPVVDALVRAADDLRARRRGELLSAARVAGVTAVLPLGLCFLPAFALLGVVPVVASLVGQVLTW